MSALRLTPAGSVARLVEGGFQNPSAITEGPHTISRAIYTVPVNTDEPVFLACGNDTATASLAATRGHVYWTQGGIAHSYAAS